MNKKLIYKVIEMAGYFLGSAETRKEDLKKKGPKMF